MSALETLADDLLLVIEDPIEIAEELNTSEANPEILRTMLMQKINDLGPDLPQWLIEWLGRSVRMILRKLNLSSASKASPYELIKIWLEFRGVKLPVPKSKPHHLYQNIIELLDQLSVTQSATGTIEIILPATERLFRLLILYFTPGVLDQPEKIILDEVLDEVKPKNEIDLDEIISSLSSMSLIKLINVISHFKKVKAPPYCNSSSNIIHLITPEENDILNQISKLDFLVDGTKTSSRDSQIFLDKLSLLFRNWRYRFNGIHLPVPKGAIIYSTVQTMYCAQLKCVDEFGNNILVDGIVTSGSSSKDSEILLEAFGDGRYWVDRLIICPDHESWRFLGLEIFNPKSDAITVASKSKEIISSSFTSLKSTNQSIDNLTDEENYVPKVFISYNHEDINIVNKIISALEQNGIEIWIDNRNSRPGEDLNEFILRSITNTDITLSIVSTKSLNSVWVSIETKISFYSSQLSNKKKLIPCYIDDNFFDENFRLKTTEKIDFKIDKINKKLGEYAEQKLDFTDLAE